MDTTCPKPRWYHLTPGRCVIGLLALEGFLLLSEWLRLFPFNRHKGWTVLIAIGCVCASLVVMVLWWLAALVFRLRFQFSLAALLVLTFAVAVPCSWLATEMKWAREQKAAVENIRSKAGGFAMYNYEYDVSLRGSAEPGGPAWLRGLLGRDFFIDVAAVQFARTTDADLEPLRSWSQLQNVGLSDTEVTDAGLEHLRGSRKLQYLFLVNTPITDAGLEHLKGLSQLECLYLGGTQVTDAGLEHLKGLSQLQGLDLCGTQVTDAGLGHLKGLSQLQLLNVSGTEVADAGLEHLNGLSQLKYLGLNGTQVTDAGMGRVRKALPNCRVQQ
jgi:hypothetical protein